MEEYKKSLKILDTANCMTKPTKQPNQCFSTGDPTITRGMPFNSCWLTNVWLSLYYTYIIIAGKALLFYNYQCFLLVTEVLNAEHYFFNDYFPDN
jgi:hypothetical protein